MSNFKKCSDCGDYDFLDRHECSPVYFVKPRDEGDEEYTQIHASSAEDAAELWAERQDSKGDYDIIRSGEAECTVKCPDGSIAEVDICAETIANYIAKEV